MDVHQRLSGVLMAVLGALGLVPVWMMLGVGLTASGPFKGLLESGWSILFLVLAVAYGLWCLTAVAGGLLAFKGSASARGLLVPAAIVALIGFPAGTAAGIYTLWSYWREGAAQPLPAWKRIKPPAVQ